MQVHWIASSVVLGFSLLLLRPVLAAECSGHVHCDVQVQLKKNPPISVTPAIGLGSGFLQQVKPNDTENLGPACVGTKVKFQVTAEDFDRHVCEPGPGERNYIQNTNLTVTILAGEGSKMEKATTVTLTSSSADNAPNRVWTGEWTLVSSVDSGSQTVTLAGKWVYFVFMGTIDDVKCPQHKGSDDDPVELEQKHYRAKLSLPVVEKVVNADTGKEGPLVVGAGETVKLRAIIKPANSGVPAGEPKWQVVKKPDSTKDVGINPDNGLLVTVTKLFDMGEYRIESATCNGGAGISIWVALDLDIDSDNTSDFGGPDGIDAEEEMEAGATEEKHKPLKFVVVNDGYDMDGQAITGFADGYNLDKKAGTADDTMGKDPPGMGPVNREVFVPIELKIGEPFQRPRLSFYYESSDPLGVKTKKEEKKKEEYFEAAPGNLRIWTYGQKEERNGHWVQEPNGMYIAGSGKQNTCWADDIGLSPGGKVTLYVEGIRESKGLGEEKIRVKAEEMTPGFDYSCEEVIGLTVIRVDVDVDSDNDNGFDEPKRDPVEDRYEDVDGLKERPGKMICVNNDDSDKDGIVDWADGFNQDGKEGTPDDQVKGEQFVPVIFEIPEPIAIGYAKLKITYDGSDPDGVKKEGGKYQLPEKGSLRLWLKKGDQKRDKKSVGAGGDWVKPEEVLDAAKLGFTDTKRFVTLYAEAVRPSKAVADQRILFEVDPDGDLRNPPNFIAADAVRMTSIAPDLVPDWNHDRVIENSERGQATASNPFRFWINDDADVGDVASGDSDLPGQSGGWWGNANYKNNKVDGRCDLLDFFPVWLDLNQVLNFLPKNSSVQCKLRQADGAVKVVYTDLTKDHAGDFLTSAGKTYGPLFKQNSFEATVTKVTSGGMPLSTEFLNKIKNDATKGVLLVEGAKTTTLPLVLEVWKDGQKICEAQMPLSLRGVEQMYRKVNLRNMQNPGTLAQPSNNPDSLSNGKNLVFLHGYQPDSGDSGDMSPWLAEMFKRYYQSGSRAKFHGVLWYSNEGDAMDYQKNVNNAFRTAPVLKNYINDLNGQVIISAHSLGNMVVSSAIVDHNMSVSKYMMCDAAVASESYDATVPQEARLVNEWWSREGSVYQERTWAANWHQLFQGTGNSRQSLTWRNRLADVANSAEVWNFYSTGDEVFDLTASPGLFTGTIGVNVNWWFILPVGVNVNVNFGRYSWQKQELFKGTRYSNGWTSFGGTSYAGWGFESTLVQTTKDGKSAWEVVPVYTDAAGANAASDDSLRSNPVFKHYPDWLVGNNALSQARINEMLGMGIPALTPSTGRTRIGSFDENQSPQFNLNSTDANEFNFKPNGWPTAGHSSPDVNKWLHNDMKDVAYYFNYTLFDKVVDGGGLK